MYMLDTKEQSVGVKSERGEHGSIYFMLDMKEQSVRANNYSLSA